MSEEIKKSYTNYILTGLSALIITSIGWTAKTLVDSKEDLAVLNARIENNTSNLESLTKETKFSNKRYDSQRENIKNEINDIKIETIRYNKYLRYSIRANNYYRTEYSPMMRTDSTINDTAR